MSVDKTTDGKVIWALRLYNQHGGYSPELVRRDTLPVLPEGRQGYVRVEEHEELLKCQGEPVAEVIMRDPLILTTGNLHTLKVGDKLYTHADPCKVEELDDERAAFEKAVIDKAERFHPNLEQYGEHPDADYRDANIEWAWGLWQARAALERKP